MKFILMQNITKKITSVKYPLYFMDDLGFELFAPSLFAVLDFSVFEGCFEVVATCKFDFSGFEWFVALELHSPDNSSSDSCKYKEVSLNSQKRC